MKILFLFICLILTTSLFAQKIYVVKNEYEANIIVYKETNKYNAKLCVFITKAQWDAKKNSNQWFFVDSRWDADYLIYYTNNKYYSPKNSKQFFTSVCFVSDKYQAKVNANVKGKIL